MSIEPTLTSGEQRRIDTLTDEMHFRELLSFASKVCFGHELKHTSRHEPHDVTSRVFAALGTRGLRSLIDENLEVLVVSDLDVASGEANGAECERIWLDATYRLPHLVGDEPNFQLVHEAKEFGQGLLDEAFKCLGQDAYDWARRFAAGDTEQQMGAVRWLYNRLNEMTQAGRGLSDTPSENFYHPARLSPLVVGQYPDYRLSPTCLGASLIAASFFEKAGATHLHAGVMQPLVHDFLEQLTWALGDFVQKNSERLGEASTEARDLLDNVYAAAISTQETRENDRGFHAANIIRLHSGKWLLFDSNFSVIQEYESGGSSGIDGIYDTLVEFEKSAPGLELSFTATRYTPAEMFAPWMQNIDAPSYDEEMLKRVLLEEDESLAQRLAKIILDPLEEKLDQDDKVMMGIWARLSNEVFCESFEQYVLWGQPLEDVLTKCRNDAEYLTRRVADLKNLWMIIAPNITIRTTDMVIQDSYQDTHSKLEIGLPAQRIGLAVLKDFDEYCGGALSPSFWVSNWSSNIPVIDALAHDSGRPGQRALNHNLADMSKPKYLIYDKADGIINLFEIAHKRSRNNAND